MPILNRRLCTLCSRVAGFLLLILMGSSPVIADELFAVPDVNHALLDTAVIGDVTINDIGTPPLAVSLATNVNSGILTLNTNGTYTYNPSSGFTGNDTFTYQVCDGVVPQTCANGVVQIAVSENTVGNDAPVALNDTDYVHVGSAFNPANVLTNDSDPDGDPLSVLASSLIGPSNGSIIMNLDGGYNYIPLATFQGVDSFSYEACDSNNVCSRATVTLIVDDDDDGGTANDAPFAAEDGISLLKSDGSGNGRVLTNDGDPQNDALTINTSPILGPYNGSLTLVNDSSVGPYVYTPNAGFTGSDQFVYEICDPSNLCARATSYIVVYPAQNNPNEIFAVPDNNLTLPGVAVSGQVLTNDIDLEGDNLTVSLSTGPSNGNLNLMADGSYTYTPDAGYVGSDSFIYQVCDDNAFPLCDTADVLIVMAQNTASNEAPIALNDVDFAFAGQTIIGNVQKNDSDPEGGGLTTPAAAVSGPSNGSIVFNVDGGYIYNPTDPTFTGKDTVVYQVCDSSLACSEATLTIIIDDDDNGGVNDPPFAGGDGASTQQDQTAAATLQNNDGDPQNDALTINTTPIVGPSNGAVAIVNDSANGPFTYTPNAGYSGPDQFVYEICDPSNACAQATVYIVVFPAAAATNNELFAMVDNNLTLPGQAVSGQVLTNDIDFEGDNLTVNTTPSALPSNGVVLLNADGRYTYIPDSGFVGRDVFGYEVCDDNAVPVCDNALVDIIVTQDTAGNDAPVALHDADYVQVGMTVIANAFTNDDDPEGDALQVTLVPVSGPSNGQITFNVDGGYVYTPNPLFEGDDQVTYEVCDSNNACSQATIFFTIDDDDNGGDNDQPFAADDGEVGPQDQTINGTILTNDGDPQNQALTINTTPVVAPQNGTLTLVNDSAVGPYTYVPNAGFSGTDRFVYEICDTENLCAQGTVHLVVYPLEATAAPGLVSLSKTVNQPTFQMGDLLSYRIQGSYQGGASDTLTLVDDLPGGFRYVDESVRLQRAGADGTLDTADDSFSIATVSGVDPVMFSFVVDPNEQFAVSYLLHTGVVQHAGDYVNTARPQLNGSDAGASASATVRLVADPMLQQTTIIGRVFADNNGNGQLDVGEQGIANARVHTVEGLVITTDAQGRYHLAAEDGGNGYRPKNFIAKVDLNSLPAGSQITSENPRVLPLTQALMSRVNFAVSLPSPASATLKPVENQTVEKQTLQAMDTDALAPIVLQKASASAPAAGQLAENRIKNPVNSQVKNNETSVIYFDSGEAKISEAYLRNLELLLQQYQQYGVSLRLTGHTDNQPIRGQLQQRFMDNQELSLARALKVAQVFSYRLNIPMANIDIQGKGADEPAASNATAAGRQLNRRVEVALVLERAPVVAVESKPTPKPIPKPTPKPTPAHPFAISQNALEWQPRLAVTAATPLQVMAGQPQPLSFYLHSNYSHFIERWQLAIYREEDQHLVHPIAQLQGQHINVATPVVWTAKDLPVTIGQRLHYQLRVYDAEGRVDSTAVKTLLVIDANGRVTSEQPGLLLGQNHLQQQHIPVYGAAVQLRSRNLAKHKVSINGQAMLIDASGHLYCEQILPPGKQSFAVNVTNADGQTQQQQLHADVQTNAFFMVGLASVTVGRQAVSGSVEPLAGDERFNEETYTDGRLAFYLKGKIQGKYLLTAQLDTTEDDLDNLDENLSRRERDTLFRQLDPDQYYPVYGDGSATVSDVDTQGALYLRLDWDDNRALWGNYHTGLTGTDLAQYNRSLYGGQLVYQTMAKNNNGQAYVNATAFAAEPETAKAQNSFVATGGSLYYLKDRRVVQGSEKIWVEVRQRDTQQILQNITLVNGRDYQIDYNQGRIILQRALSQVAQAAAPSLIDDTPLEGDDVLLHVDYEFIPNTLAGDKTLGARVKGHLGDVVGLGGTYVTEERQQTDYKLRAVDASVELAPGTYLALEYAESEAQQTAAGFVSTDGGLSFTAQSSVLATQTGEAYSAKLGVDLLELSDGTLHAGNLRAWYQDRDAGFSGSSRLTEGTATTDTGAELQLAFTENLELAARWTQFESGVGANQRERTHSSVQLQAGLTDRLSVAAEVQREQDEQNGNNVTATLGAIQLSMQLTPATEWYLKAQGELEADDAYVDNDQLSVGVNVQLDDKLAGGIELVTGDRGDAALGHVRYAMTGNTDVEFSAGVGERGHTQVGGRYIQQNGYELYGSYSVDPDQAGAQRSAITFGQRQPLGHGLRVFSEHQFLEGNAEAGMLHALGLDWALTEQWRLGVSIQHSQLDNVAKTQRHVTSLFANYAGERLDGELGLEYRQDSSSGQDVDQYVLTSALQWQVNDSWSWLSRLNAALTHDPDAGPALGRFIEADLGWAYRPVAHDEWNVLGKYSFLYDLNTPEQQTSLGNQKAHVFSLEALYALSPAWELGAKVAYRRAEVQLNREQEPWFATETGLAVTRLRYHFVHNWDALLEYRYLTQAQTEQQQHGALLGIYRHIGVHLKIGVGYNFTDFSDDLTVQNNTHQGWFLDLLGTF